MALSSLLIAPHGQDVSAAAAALAERGFVVHRAEGLAADARVHDLLVLAGGAEVLARIELPVTDGGPVVLALVPEEQDLLRLPRLGFDDFLVWPRDAHLLPARLAFLERRIANRHRWAAAKAREETVRRQEGEGLGEAGTALGAFLDATPQRVAILELADGDFVFIDVNPACARGLRSTVEAVRGKRGSEMGVSREVIEAVSRHAREAHRSGRALQVDLPAGGDVLSLTLIPLAPADSPRARVACISEEVTARRRAEQALSESEEKYRLLFSAGPEALAVVDLDAQRMVDANDAFARLLGWGNDERPLREVVQEPEALIAGMGRSPEGQGAAICRRQGGGAVPVDVRWTACGGRGRHLALAAVRERAEGPPLPDRMSTVGSLAARLAHEIDHPLGSVLSNTAFVRAELERTRAALLGAGVPADDLLQALHENAQGAERARGVARDLAAFAGAGGRAGACDVREAVELSLRLLANEIHARARLVRELEPVPPVKADAGTVAEVLLHLLTSAVRSLPEGPPDATEIRVATRARPGLVAIEVRDNRGGPSHPGGGSLAACQRLVRGLGGTFEIVTQPGHGALVRVLLPAAAVRGRVLLVDDDEMVARASSRMLADEYEVTVENDPRAALDRLRGGEQFDAVLCDVMMPGLNGIDLYEELRRARPELEPKIGFLTGDPFASPRVADFLAGLGGRSLEKPFRMDVLREFVRKLLREAKG